MHEQSGLQRIIVKRRNSRRFQRLEAAHGPSRLVLRALACVRCVAPVAVQRGLRPQTDEWSLLIAPHLATFSQYKTVSAEGAMSARAWGVAPGIWIPQVNSAESAIKARGSAVFLHRTHPEVNRAFSAGVFGFA